MKAHEFDKRFDEGEDISSELDLANARRGNEKPRRVNVDFPEWMIEALDQEARRIGVTRQSIIKLWLSERLERQYTLHEAQAHYSTDAGTGPKKS